MPAWTDLLGQLANLPDDQKSGWLTQMMGDALKSISAKRAGNNVLLYSSAFLQKPQLPGYLTQITPEDINGFMTCVHGMDYRAGLFLVLHTPGGVTQATETIVDYLRSKFARVEAIIPVYAMSAGTMISLSTNRIVMGRQSQLGPIDPQ